MEGGEHSKKNNTNNAAEYKGGKFAYIVRKNGIHHQTTVAHCPQQNGLAERMNRTIVEMARYMLNESGLPNTLWAEAVETVSYIRNRVESAATKGTTPFELFWKIKPNLQHVRIFGCDAVALAKGANRRKFNPKGRKCRLIGYSSSQKGYRLLAENGTIIISRAVKFLNEDDEKGGIDIVGDQPKPQETTTQSDPESEEEVQTDTKERATEVPPLPRRNPHRAAKEPRPKEQKHRSRPTTTAAQPPVAEDDAEIDDEAGNDTPKNFAEATSGKWQKWW